MASHILRFLTPRGVLVDSAAPLLCRGKEGTCVDSNYVKHTEVNLLVRRTLSSIFTCVPRCNNLTHPRDVGHTVDDVSNVVCFPCLSYHDIFGGRLMMAEGGLATPLQPTYLLRVRGVRGRLGILPTTQADFDRRRRHMAPTDSAACRGVCCSSYSKRSQ